jgi:threonine synthase
MTLAVSSPLGLCSPARGLVCRACAAKYPIAAQHACFECFGPLEIFYDIDELRKVTRAQIESGPKNIWRYSALLPAGQDEHDRVTLNPGFTPLVSAPGLAAELGITAPLWVKDDSANPTHSFKDRVVSVALTAAKSLGFSRFACASTGNLANSVAAHAARAGVPSIVFIPYDLEPGKVITTAVYGGELVAIEGSYDDVNRLCSELVETDDFEDTAFVNVNVRPFYAEGSKTLGYEVAEQLGWRIPAQVVIPMASGELLTKIDKAFEELVETGLATAPEGGWRVFGAQSLGCNPIATALHEGTTEIRPVKPTGIAKSLNIGDPSAARTQGRKGRRLDGLRERRRDPGCHPPARPHDGGVRRDGGRGDHCGRGQAGRGRQARPRRGDCHLQYRRRAQDHRCGGRAGGPDASSEALAQSRPGGGALAVATAASRVIRVRQPA